MKLSVTSVLAWAEHKEPAAVVGVVVSVADVAFEVAVGHPGASWHALLPLIASAVIRKFVSPAAPPAAPAPVAPPAA